LAIGELDEDRRDNSERTGHQVSCMKRRMERALAADRGQVRVVRQIIRSFLEGWKLSFLSAEAELLATELASNAIVHAGGDSFSFAIEVVGDELLIEVRDQSCRPPALLDSDPDAEGGRGVLLVAAVAKEWGTHVTGTGKTTWCSLAAAGADGP
jgi:anti-sigma regulatory factor (Ser/Thr protein kinase)